MGQSGPTDGGVQGAWRSWLRKSVEQLIYFSIAEGEEGWGVNFLKTAVKLGDLVGGWGLGRGGVWGVER